MTVTDIRPTQTEPVKATPRRAISSPPAVAPTYVSISMRVHESTEIETVRLRAAGATTVIFRDQQTGTAVEVTLPDSDMLRMLNLVGAVNEHQAAG